MATAVAFPPADPGDVRPLDPNDIDLGERLRPIDAAWATAIGQSMKRDGQIHPVDVWATKDGRWHLAGAGGHRVTGARLAGIPIDTRLVEFDGSFARRREVAENLFRRANDPLERAEAISELVRLHRANAGLEEAERRDVRTPKRLREAAAGHMEIIAMCYGWTDEIGAEIGFSGRTIRNDLAIYRGLKPSLVARLRDARHSVLKNATQLRTLARLDGAEQSAIADRLIAGARSIAEAQAMIADRPKASAEDRRLSAFLGAFTRMTLSERKGALTQLASMLPSPFQLVEGK